MQAFLTIAMLVISNIFMTCAWYGHLKMKQQFSAIQLVRTSSVAGCYPFQLVPGIL